MGVTVTIKIASFATERVEVVVFNFKIGNFLIEHNLNVQ